MALGQDYWRSMQMNSTFRLKSSIALLVLGVAMIGTPYQPAKSTLTSPSVYQLTMAASAVGAIASII